MATNKQVKANRANALRSTGPKTTTGKSVSKLNAIKHGLQAEHILLPGEKERDFHDLRDRLFETLAPEGLIEGGLAEQVAVAMWRLRRVYRIEVGVITAERLQVEVKRICGDAELKEGNLYDGNLGVFETWWFRDGDSTLADEMHEVRKQASEELSVLGFSFIKDASGANALTKLSRYETSIERSMYRALRELERVQEKRKSQAGDVDNVIDVLVGDNGALPKHAADG